MTRVLSETRIDVAEASALARLPDGRFLVADDEEGVVLAAARGHARPLTPSDETVLDDVEGLCLAGDGKAILVVSEASGEVSRVALLGRGAKVRLGACESLGSLPALGRAGKAKAGKKGKKARKGRKGKRGKRVGGKGWEGLAVLPARHAPGRRQLLVAVHEARPRRVGLFRLPSLEPAALLEPPSGPDELADLADVAVDPRNGRILLLSDESRRVVVTELRGDHLEVVGTIDLPLDRKEKPEGLDVDGEGHLWVVCDGSGRLLELCPWRGCA